MIKMTMYDLAEHPFMQEVFKDGLAADRSLGIKNIFKTKPEYSRVPTETEYYFLGVSSCAAQLLNSIQDVEDSLAYIGTSNMSARMKRSGITKHRHVRYALENFIIRSQSLHGRLLYLIDATFHLGTPEDHVSNPIIAGNVHVQMSAVSKDLAAVKKLLKKYQFLRNEVIHHRSYDEDDLRELEAYTILEGEKEKYRLRAKGLTREIVAAKKKEYERFVSDLFPMIRALFTSLKKEYSKQKIRLA